MSRFAVAGKSILEVGCGLGLSSLVLQRRGADITASDHHPMAEEFLRFNATLNDLPPIAFRRASWTGANPDLGRFDLIVGSDLLYERDHPTELGAFLARHAGPTAEIIVADPGRGQCARFNTAMIAEGYERRERRRSFPSADADVDATSGRIMTFSR
jgi:predicted nicotinamide N-methyase